MPVDSTIPLNAVPPEPWRFFLQDFDTRLKGALGGLVVTQQFTNTKTTRELSIRSKS
jgi:hypothetical protein